MFKFFASIFGSLLNFIYKFIGNYGLSIIIFSVIVKLLLLPMTIKQQKSMKKASEMQDEMKKIQDKYKNDKEKMNQEIMELYRKTGTNPFAGCFISIIQFILIISVFIMVRSPLTYMRKTDTAVIDKYVNQLKEEKGDENTKSYPEIAILREYGKDNEEISINMEFLGIDLSNIPTQNSTDFRSWIIPGLYVITSIIAIKMTTKAQQNMNKDKEKDEQMEQMEQMNKTMNLMMPIMSVSIAIIAPLGLSLYWFISNILSIVERIGLNKMQEKQEEAI